MPKPYDNPTLTSVVIHHRRGTRSLGHDVAYVRLRETVIDYRDGSTRRTPFNTAIPVK